MTDAFEMSKFFPKVDTISGLNLTQRLKAFWIDHYNKKLFSWLYNEAFREAALFLQTEGWRQGEDRSQFPRGLLTPDFKGQNSHTVTATAAAKILQDQMCVFVYVHSQW